MPGGWKGSWVNVRRLGVSHQTGVRGAHVIRHLQNVKRPASRCVAALTDASLLQSINNESTARSPFRADTGRHTIHEG